MRRLVQGRTWQERAANLKAAEVVYGVLCAFLVVCLLYTPAHAAETCPNGTPVVVDVSRCPGNSEGCFMGGVAYAPSTALKAHECDHSAGMVHTAWVHVAANYNCAIVTRAGASLREGQLLCQRIEYVGRTSIVETDTPIYVDDDPKMLRWARENLAAEHVAPRVFGSAP